jgi:hypothetical protein
MAGALAGRVLCRLAGGVGEVATWPVPLAGGVGEVAIWPVPLAGGVGQVAGSIAHGTFLEGLHNEESRNSGRTLAS